MCVGGGYRAVAAPKIPHPRHTYQEFTHKDDVVLYILTKVFADSGSNFLGNMHLYAERHLNITAATRADAPTL